MAIIIAEGKQSYTNDAGGPLAGGQLYTYDAGTTTPRLTWSDSAQTAPHTNPIILDARGEATVFWNGAYKVELRTAAGVVIWTVDNVTTDSTGGSADTLRADLALNSGSSLIGFIQNGTGAVARTVQAKMREAVTVDDFGAVQDGATNDTGAIGAAIAALGNGGGLLQVPVGYSLVTDLNLDGTCLELTQPSAFRGIGFASCGVKPSASVSSSTDTLRFSPSAAFDCTGSEISGLYFGDHTVGTRAGRNGIRLLTDTAGQFLSRLSITRNFIAPGTGPGIYHLNDPGLNVTGGFFTSVISDNNVGGGIKLENSGDSISILRNTMTGPFIGVDMAIIAGASMTEVIGNNITCAGGTLRVDSGVRFKFWNNNTENFTAGAAVQNNSASVNLTGSSGTIISGEICGNLFSVYGTSTATRVINVAGARGTLIANNVFVSGIGTCTTAIVVDATATDTRIGPNAYNVGITTKVTDNGVGTMGVVKNLTLLNGWLDFAGGTVLPGCIKSPGDGIVHLWGKIKSGTLADGTIIATLAVGFRPSGTIEAPMMANNAGVRTMGAITVESTGDVKVYGAQTTACSFNLTFPAANLADAVSYE